MGDEEVFSTCMWKKKNKQLVFEFIIRKLDDADTPSNTNDRLRLWFTLQPCDYLEPIIINDSMGSHWKKNSPIQKQRTSALDNRLAIIDER